MTRRYRRMVHSIEASAKAPPPEVWADAIRRDRAVLTLTQEICGDPRPGQSALDKRHPVMGVIPPQAGE